MTQKRLKTLAIGVGAGIAYALITLLIVHKTHKAVSIGFIFALPIIMGAIPVLFSTKAQLKSYISYLLVPWISVLTFFAFSIVLRLEGSICIVIIIAPFLLLGSLGAFIYRMIRLKQDGDNSPRLYISLLIPFAILMLESAFTPSDHYGTVRTTMTIAASKAQVWENIKNVKNIQSSEITPHFIHKIGIPKPLNGELDFEGVGGTRSILWEKNLQFRERIKTWDEGNGFSYDIEVNPGDIPPTTLDEHVIVGGKYFDAVEGGYQIRSIHENLQEVTLYSTYRITSTVNFYGKYWADFIFDDFHEMILEVIKKRCEM